MVVFGLRKITFVSFLMQKSCHRRMLLAFIWPVRLDIKKTRELKSKKHCNTSLMFF